MFPGQSVEQLLGVPKNLRQHGRCMRTNTVSRGLRLPGGHSAERGQVHCAGRMSLSFPRQKLPRGELGQKRLQPMVGFFCCKEFLMFVRGLISSVQQDFFH